MRQHVLATAEATNLSCFVALGTPDQTRLLAGWAVPEHECILYKNRVQQKDETLSRPATILAGIHFSFWNCIVLIGFAVSGLEDELPTPLNYQVSRRWGFHPGEHG